MKSKIILLGVLFMAAFECSSSDKVGKTVVRQPAVAGSWYSSDPQELRTSIRSYLAKARPLGKPVRMLISPHAGYQYSGPVAASGYASISNDITTVIIIAPLHHAWLNGISIPEVDAYRTPLGDIPLDTKIVAVLRKSSLMQPMPPQDRMEHSLEIQLPFLQVILPRFSLVPISAGKVDPGAVADLLAPLITSTTLVVASSDLSHFHSHEDAKKIDSRTIENILLGQPDQIDGEDACGHMPIRIVMHLAKKLGLKPQLIDARNSWETAGIDKSRVVGYCAIGYIDAAAEPPKSSDLQDDVKKWLLGIARESLQRAVRGQPALLPNSPPAAALQHSGCFVTLTKHGELRGCIGYIEGIKPLYEAVIDNTANAALRDPRFTAVKPEELDDIKIEISVLTKPEPIQFKTPQELLDKIVPYVDGIILQKGFHQSTFLPQVWQQLPDKIQFLEHLSVKGGMPKDGWKSSSVKRYKAIHFEEY